MLTKLKQVVQSRDSNQMELLVCPVGSLVE